MRALRFIGLLRFIGTLRFVRTKIIMSALRFMSVFKFMSMLRSSQYQHTYRPNSVFAGTLLLAVSLFSPSTSASENNHILVQSTTSTANSGFYKYLLPQFESQTGITVNVVAVGTGQAIRNARNCDADVLLVHAKADENAFVADGYGVKRFDLMYNDFVIIGPLADHAQVKVESTIDAALQKIAESDSLFASRGDDSGTHKKELALWQVANIDTNSDNAESWYRSTGSGMGATINTAIGLGAYTITDRATWISFKNKRDYEVLFEGDPTLFNQYGVIIINQDKCPSVSTMQAQLFVDWLLSKDTQNTIAQFKVSGQQLFFPNAK